MNFLFQFVIAILTPLLVTAPMRAEIAQSDAPATLQIHLVLIDRDKDTTLVGSQSEKGFSVQVADSSGAPVEESAVVFRLPDEGASGVFADGARSAIVYTSADGRAKVSGIKWSDVPGLVAIKITATKGEARAGFLLQETLMTAESTPAPVSVATAPPAPSAPAASDAKEAVEAIATVSAPAPEQPGKPREVSASASAPAVPAPAAPPAVSIVNTNGHEKLYGHSHKKWIILAAVVAVGAGAALAMGSKGKSTTTTTPTAGISVGTPSISVGQP
jgi:hypothetical protein